MNDEMPLVSVVTVCFNAVNSIESTILSVINQNYPFIEYLIIDGGSSDGTVEVVQRFSNNITLFLSEPDKGIYDAMNKGIYYAKGQWVIFMNAGDLFYDENVLDSIFRRVISSKISVIYGDNIRLFKLGPTEYHKARSLHSLHSGIMACHQSILVSLRDKSLIYFDLSYRLCADYNQIYSLYKNNGDEAFLYLPQPISCYEYDAGFSATNKRTCIIEKMSIHLRNKEFLSLGKDIILFLLYTLHLK